MSLKIATTAALDYVRVTIENICPRFSKEFIVFALTSRMLPGSVDGRSCRRPCYRVLLCPAAAAPGNCVGFIWFTASYDQYCRSCYWR